MSKNDKQQALVPRLRFPEFRDAPEWNSFLLEQLKAKRHIAIGRGMVISHDDMRANPGSYPVYSSSVINDGLMGTFGDYMFDEELISWSIDGGGHFFHRPKHKFSITNVSGYIRILSDDIVCSFLAYQLQQLHASKTFDYQQKAHPSVICKIYSVLIPERAEQQKIADCLGSLDDLIAAEGRKLAALREHKKGLMQQLFPREGETRPRLRFPEFRNAGEWKPQAIEELCEILNNRRIPITSSDRAPGPYPYYGASGIVDYINDYIFDERLVLVGEDGAKWKAFEPTAFIADGKYWVNNHAHVLKPVGIIDTLLVSYLTLMDVGKYVTGTAPPKLTLKKLRAIPIPVPPLDEEQQRIANCLSFLDALIDAQTKKLDALRRHKRGLMQQLFPSPEADES